MAVNDVRGRIPYKKINEIHSFSNSHVGWFINLVAIVMGAVTAMTVGGASIVGGASVVAVGLAAGVVVGVAATAILNALANG